MGSRSRARARKKRRGLARSSRSSEPPRVGRTCVIIGVSCFMGAAILYVGAWSCMGESYKQYGHVHIPAAALLLALALTAMSIWCLRTWFKERASRGKAEE